jgi:hypothetical protein
MTPRTRTGVDRTVLGLGGLVLALAGSWLAATDRTVTDRLPSWWLPTPAGSVLLNRESLAHLRFEGWWTPTVMAAAIALTVLCAYATLDRFRPRRTRPITLPSPGGTVRHRALAEALSARVEALPGVARGRGRVLPRPGRRLEIGLWVWLEPGTAPEAVLPALCAVAAQAERAAAPYRAHTRVRPSAAAPRRSAHVR